MRFWESVLHFLRTNWIQVAFLDIDLDADVSLAIDILAINAGNNTGLHFQGSLFMFYLEPGYLYMGRETHITWDILYLRQWWKPTFPRD